MGIKLHAFKTDADGSINYVFHCPGCNHGHPINVPRWTWNESLDKPTFSPSLLCNGFDPKSRCHSFIKNGMVQFLNDCWHTLAGQTVEIPDWED